MIPKQGVIYRYTPQSKTIDRSQPLQKKGPPPFSSNTQQQTLNKPPRIKPVPTVFPPIPKLNTPPKQPVPQPRFVPKNNPLRPTRLKPPTPFGAKKPVDWNNPFAFDPFDDDVPQVPPTYETATSLRDFTPSAPPPTKPVEMHHGLPVEETPEIPLMTPSVVDSAYVDRLFGDQPAKPPVTEEQTNPEPVSPINPEPQIPVKPVIEPQEQIKPEPIVKPTVSPSTEPAQTQQPTPHSEKPVKKGFSFATLFAKKQEHKAINNPEVVPHIESQKTAPIDTPATPANSNEHREQVVAPAVPVQPSHEVPKHVETHTDATKAPVLPVGDSSHHTAAPSPHSDHQPIPPNPLDILKPKFKFKRTLGILLILLALYGISMPLIPKITLESTYAEILEGEEQKMQEDLLRPLPPSVPIGFNPMMAPDGKIIEPVNKEFSIVIPAVGINSPIIAGVNPLDQKSYKPALEKGVAHAKTSYLPTQEGSMYLFSHSTNYDWFVKDLNAIFYNVKNLKDGNYIIVFYKGKRYVYEYKERKIVSPKDTSYLLPTTGKKTLILQTCWPPGSISQRLLVFADLVDESYPTVIPEIIP